MSPSFLPLRYLLPFLHFPPFPFAFSLDPLTSFSFLSPPLLVILVYPMRLLRYESETSYDCSLRIHTWATISNQCFIRVKKAQVSRSLSSSKRIAIMMRSFSSPCFSFSFSFSFSFLFHILSTIVDEFIRGPFCSRVGSGLRSQGRLRSVAILCEPLLSQLHRSVVLIARGNHLCRSSPHPILQLDFRHLLFPQPDPSPLFSSSRLRSILHLLFTSFPIDRF